MNKDDSSASKVADTTPDKRAKRVFRGAAFLIGIVAAVFSAELVLRIVGYWDLGPILYQPDTVLGWSLRPGAKVLQTREGRAWVEVNSEGRRDGISTDGQEELPMKIAILGDSFAEAVQVEADQTFWYLAGEELQRCTGTPTGVLNFGVSGFGTAQQLLQLERDVLPLKPELVVLAFFPGNDVVNNSADLETELQRPFFSIVGGELVLDNSFRNSVEFRQRIAFESRSDIAFRRWIRRHFRIYQLLAHIRSLPGRSASQNQGLNREAGLSSGVFDPPVDQDWDEAWAITEALVDRIQRSCLERGVDFLLLLLTAGEQLPLDESRIPIDQKTGADTWYPNRRLAAFAASRGIQCLDLLPRMVKAQKENGRAVHGFEPNSIGRGHWNADGHAVAAKALAEHLCEEVRRAQSVSLHP